MTSLRHHFLLSFQNYTLKHLTNYIIIFLVLKQEEVWTIFRLVLSVMSCLVLSCLVFLCLVLSCVIVSSCVLSCLAIVIVVFLFLFFLFLSLCLCVCVCVCVCHCVLRGFEYRNSYCLKDIANPRRHCLQQIPSTVYD
jgi:hypothetical protein